MHMLDNYATMRCASVRKSVMLWCRPSAIVVHSSKQQLILKEVYVKRYSLAALLENIYLLDHLHKCFKTGLDVIFRPAL